MKVIDFNAVDWVDNKPFFNGVKLTADNDYIYMDNERVLFKNVPLSMPDIWQKNTADSVSEQVNNTSDNTSDNTSSIANDPDIIRLKNNLKEEHEKLEKFTKEKKAEIQKINEKYKYKIDTCRKHIDHIEMMIAKRVISIQGLDNVLKLAY